MKLPAYVLPVVIATVLGWSADLSATPSYRFLAEIPVGGSGGWDYLTVDPDARRLYVSHATKIVVIDLEKNTVVGEIADTPGVHGIALVPDLKRGFTTNGRENKASVVDLATLKTIGKVDTGANPDGMLYEPSRREVYVFNGRGGSATVINAKTAKVTATIPLGGKPEFAVADSKAGRVYNNLEDTDEVVAIDTVAHRVVNRWPIAPGKEASGIAVDLAHGRLFLGCGNERMIMMDAGTGKVLASVPIGSGVDANAFDPGTGLAFASCADGTVTIAHEDSPGSLTVVQTLKTEPRAKTMALDPKTHRIYLASARYETPGDARASDPAKPSRPAMVPGSFKVLVYGME